MAIPLEQFTHELLALGVLSESELTPFLPPQAPRRTAAELAYVLIDAGRVTRFQAAAILRGASSSLTLGNYLLIDSLGAGGMGQVYKAFHRRMDRIVAIKTLHADFVKDRTAVARFDREVRAAAKLIHPNIVRAYDADCDRDIHFLAMEFVEGQDLSKIVKRLQPLDAAQAIDCIVQAARGLAYAHRAGIIHRDIKPANLLLDHAGVIKVLDMGLARMARSEKDVAHFDLTGADTIIGTVDYMAPEQAANTRSADARSDIYSLGCTLHFLLSGQALHGGSTAVERLIAHREKPAPTLAATIAADLPSGLEASFNKMVAKDPADRYQTMEEVILALEQCKFENHSASATIRMPAPSPPKVDLPQLEDLSPETSDTDLPVTKPMVAERRVAARGEASPGRWRVFLMAAGGLAVAALLFWVSLGSGERASPPQPPGADSVASPAPADDPTTRAIADASPAITPRVNPFAVFREGKLVAECGALESAYSRLGPRDTIEVHSNGPFFWKDLDEIEKPFTLRAAAGYRPFFRVIRTIRVKEQPISVVGCDFSASGPMFSGAGSEWTFEHCRLWGATSLDFRGGRLRFDHSLLDAPVNRAHSLVTLASSARLELDHCCVAGSYLAEVRAPGCEIQLTDSTCFLAGVVDYQAASAGDVARIDAARNVLRIYPGAAHGLLPGKAAAAYQWHGQENLLAGLWLSSVEGDKAGPSMMSDWISAHETDSRVADDVQFEIDHLAELQGAPLLGELEPRLGALRRLYPLAELGPELSLVGPGDAYVRALIAEGRLSGDERLRPAPAAGGPFAIVRQGIAVSGHALLQDALDAAISDDTIEIRGDGPFQGGNPKGDGRRLSIVAAPGYLPTFNTAIIGVGSDRLTIEGLRLIRGAGPESTRANLESARFRGSEEALYGTPGYFARVANTAVEDDYLAGWVQGPDGKPAEIVNCLIDKASPTPFAGGVAELRNCVVRQLRLRSPRPAGVVSVQFHLDRCVLWHPGPPPQDSVGDEAVWLLGPDLTARRTWFFSGQPILRMDSQNSWRGSQNLFSAVEFSASQPLSQELLGREIASDFDSFVAPPPLADPANWRLLRGSPGASAGPGGKDLGADVDQILTR